MTVNRLFAAAVVGLAAASFSYADRVEAATFTQFIGTIDLAAGGTITSDANGFFSGNDCAGVFSNPNGFNTCLLFGSPVIAKWDMNNDAQMSSFEANPAFPVTSTDFLVSHDSSDGWSFTYNPDGKDTLPGVTAFSVKAGPGFFVYKRDGDAFLGETLSNILFNSPRGSLDEPDLSHIVIYDSLVPIPLPAAAWMLLSALGGLGFLGWRRKQVA